MTRERAEKRANKIGKTITGSKGAYYIDDIDTDILDRRGRPYSSLEEVADGIEWLVEQQKPEYQ